MRIAQVGATDSGGGAAVVATSLHRAFNSRGHEARLFVGRKSTADHTVEPLPDDDRWFFRALGYTAVQRGLGVLAGRYPDRGFGLAGRTLRLLTHPQAMASRWSGADDRWFPGATSTLMRYKADIVQTHNLHGGFFDLEALGTISRARPTVVTLHDMWLLTGHCGHALECSRWRTGCGACPDLLREPAVARDATADNWTRKRDIYASGRLHIVTPSVWLRDQVAASMLAPHARSLRVIHNGVDTRVFCPADRGSVRRRLGLNPDSHVVLVTTGSKGSMWKDDRLLRDAINLIGQCDLPRPIEFLAVGRESALTGTRNVTTRSVPFQDQPERMAAFYQAADVYLQASRADSFPLAVLEAMACGTAVVATRVGGIAEQIVPAALDAVRARIVGPATGMLVDRGDAWQMADAVEALLDDDTVRAQMGRNAVADVRARFTLDRQAEAYLDCYREVSDAEELHARS